MAFMYWLEQSALADMVAASLWGYPIMLTLHAVGLAIVVGVLFMVDLRVMGCFNQLELTPMRKLISLARWGFVVNLLSGFALFAAQASWFITHKAFIIKIIAIILAVVNALILKSLLTKNAEDWDNGVAISSNAKMLAFSSLILWSVAMIAGRLIAYV